MSLTVDEVIGTPFGTSAHSFVSCVLRVEQSVPEYNARSTVFLKHRTNWDSVRSLVRSFTWNTILESADLLVAIDRAIGEVIGRYVPTTVLRIRSGGKQWFDGSCWRAYNAKQTAYVPDVEHAMLNIGVNLCLLVMRPRWSMVPQGSRIMSTQGYSEALYPSIPAPVTFYSCSQGTGCGLVVVPAEKSSLLDSQSGQ